MEYQEPAMYYAVRDVYSDCVGIGIRDDGTRRADFSTSTLPNKQLAADAIVAVHDPVFLSVDKVGIVANGFDTATVTVRAPKPDAAAVTLLIQANNEAPTESPVALVNGIGTETIRSQDPCKITVSVKNPSNRTTDVIVIWSN